MQLRAKQKLKGYYGDLREKQFRAIFDEADRRKGDTSENLIGLLESRLDAIVYRAKFVPTVFAARQFVNHGHVKVNGVRVNIGSYRCKAGDVIEVRREVEAARYRFWNRLRSLSATFRTTSKSTTTRWLPPSLAFRLSPTYRTPVVMEPHLVVEFYSR